MTDCIKPRVIEFIMAMEDARNILRQEAAAGDLYSGLQADVLEPIIRNLKVIIEGKVDV